MIFIIAELGTNHMGDIKIVKKLIDVAVSAGCNAVKLQKRNVEKIFTKEFLDSPIESPWGTTNRQQKNGLEFDLDDYKVIDAYCKEKSKHLLEIANNLTSEHTSDIKRTKNALIQYAELLLE